MNVRIAKKVVARFPVKPDRYNREQIEKAYRILDRPVDAHKMAVWEAAGEKVKADLEARKATVALRAERNAEKKAASKARIEGQRAARQAKKEAAVKPVVPKKKPAGFTTNIVLLLLAVCGIGLAVLGIMAYLVSAMK